MSIVWSLLQQILFQWSPSLFHSLIPDWEQQQGAGMYQCDWLNLLCGSSLTMTGEARAVTRVSRPSHTDIRLGWLHLVSVYNTDSLMQAERTTGSLASLAATLCPFCGKSIDTQSYRHSPFYSATVLLDAQIFCFWYVFFFFQQISNLKPQKSKIYDLGEVQLIRICHPSCLQLDLYVETQKVQTGERLEVDEDVLMCRLYR